VAPPVPTLLGPSKNPKPDTPKTPNPNCKTPSGASGSIRPGIVTLLLSPPGSGKTTLLKALGGRIHQQGSGSLKVAPPLSTRPRSSLTIVLEVPPLRTAADTTECGSDEQFFEGRYRGKVWEPLECTSGVTEVTKP
jgi:energy-coupling factor transporter ATP-binding protein EcfA2